jgi:metal-sulfur cluster biosynthetic enzyme
MKSSSPLLVALEGVRDPELDAPITTLGFVSSCTVTPDGDAEVHLRLPTYFCAPNFAFLMVADAYDAVSVLDGVHSTRIVLEDHFASDAINHGVAARAGFEQAFEGEAAGELDDLRRDFLRKAVMAGTDQVCRPLTGDPATMTLADVPPSPALESLRRRRAELGLPSGDDAPLLIDPVTGGPVADAPLHLRRARLHRVGIEANTSICSGMLRHRYTSGEAR